MSSPSERGPSPHTPRTSSWLWGRGTEKDKEKDKEKWDLLARGKSLHLKRNKKREAMVLTSEKKVEDSVFPQPVRRGSSLKIPKSDRLPVRKASLPETNHEAQKATPQMERKNIAPRERMGEGDYSRHLSLPNDLSADLQPQEKPRESRWVKAMNACNLDSIHLKNSQRNGALPATCASLHGPASGRRPPSSKNELAVGEDMPTQEDFQVSDESPRHSPSQAWCSSSSSDEAEDGEFKLQGLSPRPITRDEQPKKYLELVKEQRWAEAKLGCELGIVFDSKVKKPNSQTQDTASMTG